MFISSFLTISTLLSNRFCKHDETSHVKDANNKVHAEGWQ